MDIPEPRAGCRPNAMGLCLELNNKIHLSKKHMSTFICPENNTAYYHRLIATRKSINHIHYLMDDNNSRVETQSGILDLCLQHSPR
ncbi:hypothetical protein YC2023_076811 [Brassica napus]